MTKSTKELQDKKNNDDIIIKYLKDNGIYFILRGSKFMCFEPVNGRPDSYDREWIHSSPRELCDTIQLDLGIKVTPTDLKDLAIDNALAKHKHTITKSDVQNPKALNMAAVEEEYWIYNRNIYKTLEPKCNRYIDTLIYSLAGGDADNKKHIEQWISYKLFRATDSGTLPALNIFGQGGTGKNLFYEYLIPTMFHGAESVTNANMKQVGGFNGHFEGKRFAVFNESSSDKADTEGLKTIVGSKKLPIEKKGVDKYEADNLLSVLLFTNDQLGSIKLDKQDGVNRRWSVIKCTKTLKEVIGDLYPAEDVDEFLDELVDTLQDEKQVGAWVKYLEDNVLTSRPPKAHHGRDYRELKQDTRSPAELFFDYVFNGLNLSKIPVTVAQDCIKALHKEHTGQSAKRTSVTAFCKDALIALDLKEVDNKQSKINGKNVKCFVNPNGSAEYNEAEFLNLGGDVRSDLHRVIENGIDNTNSGCASNVLDFNTVKNKIIGVEKSTLGNNTLRGGGQI